ncbi:MAG: hypothetical protein WBF77_01275 [Sulfurimonadaceae bacterium]
MNFELLKNKNIILFGKSRALNRDEFAKQLLNHNIVLVDDVDDGVEVIVEGRLVNPIEQDELDRLYTEKVAPIIQIEALEKWLCKAIDVDKLLMSLKLSGDRDRLMGYLQNKHISNELFLRLLKFYNWEGVGFFESDDNRDITAALISRFYENIERNHNVQYANMGIMHLLNQSANAELTETIALLAPLQTALKEGCENSTQKILNAIALHPSTSTKVLKQWLKKGNDDIQMLIAMRHDLDLQLQQYLLNLAKPIVNETLSLNHTIEHQIALVLLKEFPENIAKHITLDMELFGDLLEQYDFALAQNLTLQLEMQERLLERGEDVQIILAKNAKITSSVFETLFASDKVEVLRSLIANEQMQGDGLLELFNRDAELFGSEIAANAKTDVSILHQLAGSQDIEVLLALAKNPSTPVELLYQFQLDRRLERAVKENSSFGKHIQRDNIGWDV